MTESAGLGIGREALVDVSAAVASRDSRALERSLELARRVASPESVDEVLLQSHLFVGFPLALEALLLWRRLAPVDAPSGVEEPPELWEERGEAVCRSVYGRSYLKLRENVARLHPDLDRWMVAGGYGRVIGRSALSLATRELCIVALLAVWGAPRQLHSHLRGAVNTGSSEGEVTAAVEIGCRYLDPARASEVRRLWAEIASGNRRGAAAEK